MVIRYNKFSTTKSQIQGSGRARHIGSEIYYFENDVDKEQIEAQNLCNIARDPKLGGKKTLKSHDSRFCSRLFDKLFI